MNNTSSPQEVFDARDHSELLAEAWKAASLGLGSESSESSEESPELSAQIGHMAQHGVSQSGAVELSRSMPGATVDEVQAAIERTQERIEEMLIRTAEVVSARQAHANQVAKGDFTGVA